MRSRHCGTAGAMSAIAGIGKGDKPADLPVPAIGESSSSLSISTDRQGTRAQHSQRPYRRADEVIE